MDYRTPRISQPGTLCVRPWLLLAIVILAGGLLAWAALVFRQSNDDTRAMVVELQGAIAGYQAELEELQAERDQLLSKNAALERASQVDREALRGIRESLKQDQEARLAMEEELAFLKGIMEDKESREALHIVGVELRRTDDPEVVDYRFTVRKTFNDGETATGSVFIAVDGKRDGQAHWYPLRELTADKTESVRVKFKHFQDIEGSLSLPPAFEPSHLVIEIKPSDEGLAPVKERFAWAVRD